MTGLIMDKLKKSGLNLVHLNVGSILAKGRIELLRVQTEATHIDVFCMSESWLTASIPDGLVHIAGYEQTRLDRDWNDTGDSKTPKRGGGLICYVRNDVPMSDAMYQHLNVSCKDLEMQWITIKMYNMRRIVILNIYRPPQGN